jgi:uncharacterized cupin superfamily protein
MDLPRIVHESDIPEIESAYPEPFDGEKLSHCRDLGGSAGTVNFGLVRERIPPGRRTSFTHAHSVEEELLYVLQGECVLRLIAPGGPPREFPLRAGHTVAFPAGTGIAHTVHNRGSEDCVVLSFGERRHDVDRVFYAEDVEYDADLARKRPERHWKREGGR